MRKKFIGVYALMAVLALGTTVTSCVDDTESPTVTAIRDAKLKQLQALASQAESEAKINAIEAQIKEATSAAELSVLQAKLDAELAQYQQDKASWEQMMATNLSSYQTNLYQSYNFASQDVVDLIKRISMKKIELAELKADSTTAAAYAQTLIADKKLDILYQETLKASYEKLEKVDFEELEKNLANAKLDQETKDKAVNDAGEALSIAWNTFSESKANIIRRYLYTDGNGNSYISETKPNIYEYQILDPDDEVAKAAYVLKDLQSEYSWVFSSLNADIVSSDYKRVSEESYIGLDQFEILSSIQPKAVRLVEDYVANQKAWLGTDKDDETKSTAWGNHAKLVKAVETAEKNLADAVKADPDGDHTTLEIALESAESLLAADTEKNGTLYLAQESVKKAEEMQKTFTDAIAVFNDATKYKAYTDKVSAILSKEGQAILDAQEAEWNAKEELYIANANYNSAFNVYSSAENVDKLIAECDTRIEMYNKDLLKYQELYISIYDQGNGIGYTEQTYTFEALVEAGEYELSVLESEKEIKQALADQYKSQLEASLNGASTNPAPAE